MNKGNIRYSIKKKRFSRFESEQRWVYEYLCKHKYYYRPKYATLESVSISGRSKRNV